MNFVLEKELKCLYDKATSSLLEKQWDQILRLLTWTLNFWYANRIEKATCSLCNKDQDNMKHLYIKCELSMEIYTNLNCSTSNWYTFILTKPIYVHEDPIISSDSVTNFCGKLQDSIEIKDKLKIQKRIYQLVKKTIIWSIWRNRCLQIFEKEGITEAKALIPFVKNQILHQIFKFSLLLTSINEKLYVEKLSQVILKAETKQNNETNSSKENNIMLFDGGSRENPGPGGSGSVVISYRIMGNEIQITEINMVSTYISNYTTNNISEYLGFYISLLINKKRTTTIKVVGDSKLVLSQLELLKISKNQNLKAIQENIYYYLQFYQEIEYEHHYRNTNKTADLLANQAMDEKNITKISTKSIGNQIDQEKVKQYLKNIENDLGKKIMNFESIKLYKKFYDWKEHTEIKDIIKQIKNYLD